MPLGGPPSSEIRASALRRRLGVALTVAGLLFVAFATLTPGSDPCRRALLTPLLCLVCGEEGGGDIAANLLLFLPLAIGLRLSGLSWLRTVALSAGLSFTVELLQYQVIPGRDASLSDLLSNTTGAAIGAALAPLLLRAILPPPRAARALLAGGIAAWLAAMGLAAWLLAPAEPGGPLVSLWAGAAPVCGAFGGSVHSVRLNGLPMPPDGTPFDRGTPRPGLDRGAFTLEASLISGVPVPDASWIYMLRGPSNAVLTLYQHRRQAGVAVPARGLRFLLRPVRLTLRDGLPATAGVAVRLRAAERDGVIHLSSTYAGVERSVAIGISPSYGWMLLSPFEVGVGIEVRLFTGLCLALSLVPLGFWARRTARPGGSLALLAAGVAAGLALVPALAGFPPVHPSEWAAAALGAAAGWAVERVAAYLERRCVSPFDTESSSS